MPENGDSRIDPLQGESRGRRLARPVLVAFLFTFMAARILALMIVLGWLPDFYVRLGGTHIHHLNYGIFLLSGVGAYLLFATPKARALYATSILYGIGLALTFDEFGLWLHLGGSYWQRASFDAVVVIVGILALVSVAPAIHRFRPHYWVTALGLVVLMTVFAILLLRSLSFADELLLKLETIEETQDLP